MTPGFLCFFLEMLPLIHQSAGPMDKSEVTTKSNLWYKDLKALLPSSLVLSPLWETCPPLDGPGVPTEGVEWESSMSLQDAGFWEVMERYKEMKQGRKRRVKRKAIKVQYEFHYAVKQRHKDKQCDNTSLSMRKVWLYEQKEQQQQFSNPAACGSCRVPTVSVTRVGEKPAFIGLTGLPLTL